MTDTMGTFRASIELENPARPGERRRVDALLVDTGSELTWVPTPLLESLGVVRVKRLRFRQATGQIVERWIGGATVFAAGTQTLDDVVFGEPGDQSLLGARLHLLDRHPAPHATAASGTQQLPLAATIIPRPSDRYFFLAISGGSLSAARIAPHAVISGGSAAANCGTASPSATSTALVGCTVASAPTIAIIAPTSACTPFGRFAGEPTGEPAGPAFPFFVSCT